MPFLETVLFETTTAVDSYQIVERQYEGRPARVLFSGSRRAAQSGTALDDKPDLLFDYNQRLLELANGLYPKRILVIGGGAFTLPMALTAALPDALIDVVELDAALPGIAEEYFGLRANERLRVHIADGRQFLQASSEQYDLIVLDVFSELRIPRQFLTMECIMLYRAHCAPGGAVAMNIIASYKGKNDDLIKSQIAGYGQQFDRLDIYPAAHGLTSWLPQNLIVVAQRTPTEDYKDYLRFAAIEAPEAEPSDQLYD